MENEQSLNEFATYLQREIDNIVEVNASDKLRPEAFTEYMIEMLIEAGEIEDGLACYYGARGVEASGYNLDNDGTLNLFITDYTYAFSPPTINRTEVQKYFKKLYNFMQKTFEKLYLTIEEASPAFDMVQDIFERSQDINRVRLYFFTDGLTAVDNMADVQLNKVRISYHVWDLRRIYRYKSSGTHRVPIHIDFTKQFGSPLPCIQGTHDVADYNAYLTIIPGNILSSLYGLYGARLLELNVRSFLQSKGKVNQGIRRTILDEPERFLAYNNGISATASNIELVPLPDGGLGIQSLDDLQIVNGGQTTASIFHTVNKDKADVSRVQVQAKISVVTPEDVAKLVPLISRYANSQNKVNEADFSANEPFHVELEKLSRLIWAPPVAGSQLQTQWFYERARGQYQDAIVREATSAHQRQFKENHPTTQKFSKTDLAKFEMTWEQAPEVVSLGAQKCFNKFTALQSKRGILEIDNTYFHHLIAKAILFRQAEKIIGAQDFGGYRANIVTYTLAYIFYHTDKRIDLDRIWRQQNIGSGLRSTIEYASQQIHKVIISPPNGKNITEWCKHPNCWKNVKGLQINLSASLDSELLAIGPKSLDKDNEEIDPIEQQQIAQVAAILGDKWDQLASWAKETHNLNAWQRTLAINLARIQRSDKLPSKKQAVQGLLILEEASKLGFKLEPIMEIAD